MYFWGLEIWPNLYLKNRCKPVWELFYRLFSNSSFWRAKTVSPDLISSGVSERTIRNSGAFWIPMLESALGLELQSRF